MSDFQGPSYSELQGEWSCVSYGDDGHKVPFYLIWLRKPRIEFEGHEYRMFHGETCLESGRFDIQRGVEYSILDQLIEFGEHHGQERRGIIRWKGDKLEHLQGHAGYPRPTGFPYGKGFKCHYCLLRRAPKAAVEHPVTAPKTWKG